VPCCQGRGHCSGSAFLVRLPDLPARTVSGDDPGTSDDHPVAIPILYNFIGIGGSPPCGSALHRTGWSVVIRNVPRILSANTDQPLGTAGIVDNPRDVSIANRGRIIFHIRRSSYDLSFHAGQRWTLIRHRRRRIQGNTSSKGPANAGRIIGRRIEKAAMFRENRSIAASPHRLARILRYETSNQRSMAGHSSSQIRA
jgi:hypothetical protein